MVMQGLTQRPVIANFLTNSFRLMGKVYVPTSGLLTLMNDHSSVYAEVIQAQMARLATPSQVVDQYEVTRLVKQHIAAVCITRREDVGPQAFPRLGFAPLIDYPVDIVTDYYEINGVIQWAGRLDFASLMSVDTADFFAMYKATITSIQVPNLIVESPIVLLNRGHISAITLLNPSGKDFG